MIRLISSDETFVEIPFPFVDLHGHSKFAIENIVKAFKDYVYQNGGVFGKDTSKSFVNRKTEDGVSEWRLIPTPDKSPRDPEPNTHVIDGQPYDYFPGLATPFRLTAAYEKFVAQVGFAYVYDILNQPGVKRVILDESIHSISVQSEDGSSVEFGSIPNHIRTTFFNLPVMQLDEETIEKGADDSKYNHLHLPIERDDFDHIATHYVGNEWVKQLREFEQSKNNNNPKI